MKKTVQVPVAAEVELSNAAEEQKTHPLMKSYMFVSKKHVDYNDLSAFESASLSLVLVLAVTAGVIMSINV